MPLPTYEEAKKIGAELRQLGPKLVDLRKQNRVAFYVSNRALTAYNAFKPGRDAGYNDVLRPLYDALYRMNVEVEFIHPGTAAPATARNPFAAGKDMLTGQTHVAGTAVKLAPWGVAILEEHGD